MKTYSTGMDGLILIEPLCFQDERGIFLETYQQDRYLDAGILDNFVQDNQSRSAKGALRGMHFQVHRPQAQIVTVMRGSIYDVVVDLRQYSSTYGRWFGVELSDSGPRQLYMPPGFAHGFCVLSEWADLHYKVSRFYDHEDEGGLVWNDADIGIIWPINNPQLSARDSAYSNFKNLQHSQLPHHPPVEKNKK